MNASTPSCADDGNASVHLACSMQSESAECTSLIIEQESLYTEPRPEQRPLCRWGINWGSTTHEDRNMCLVESKFGSGNTIMIIHLPFLLHRCAAFRCMGCSMNKKPPQALHIVSLNKAVAGAATGPGESYSTDVVHRWRLDPLCQQEAGVTRHQLGQGYSLTHKATRRYTGVETQRENDSMTHPAFCNRRCMC